MSLNSPINELTFRKRVPCKTSVFLQAPREFAGLYCPIVSLALHCGWCPQLNQIELQMPPFPWLIWGCDLGPLPFFSLLFSEGLNISWKRDNPQTSQADSSFVPAQAAVRNKKEENHEDEKTHHENGVTKKKTVSHLWAQKQLHSHELNSIHQSIQQSLPPNIHTQILNDKYINTWYINASMPQCINSSMWKLFAYLRAPLKLIIDSVIRFFAPDHFQLLSLCPEWNKQGISRQGRRNQADKEKSGWCAIV